MSLRETLNRKELTQHRDIKKKMYNLKIMFITNNNYEQKQSYV